MKDPAEALLEPGEFKKSDMFFEYRIKEGEEVGLWTVKQDSCFRFNTLSSCIAGFPGASS